MQGRIAPFGFGLLAGLGIGVGYWQGYQQLRETESDAVVVEEDTSTREKQLFKYDRPESPYSTHTYTSHSVLYDHCRKVPLWSAERISAHNVSGGANRKKSKFKPDPRIPAKFSSANKDYWKSGWSRGHMTPAGDCKHSQEAMDDSHYLTNIVPQDLNNNSGFWNRLELYCRDLTKKYSTVLVISGPLYLPREEGGKKYVKYQVIGDSNVAVPTHLYKVILAEMASDAATSTPTLGVFVIPNQPLGDEELSQFQTTLSNLESLSGITFHSKLDTSQVGNLCQTDSCKLMTTLELKQFVFIKRLRSAGSVQKVEDILSEAERSGLGSDSAIVQTATQKRTELTQHTGPSQSCSEG